MVTPGFECSFGAGEFAIDGSVVFEIRSSERRFDAVVTMPSQ